MPNNPHPSYFDYANFDWTDAQALIDSGVKLHRVAEVLGLSTVSSRIIYVAIQKGYLNKVYYVNGVKQPYITGISLPLVYTDLVDLPQPGNPSANFFGTISSDGNDAILERGFVWSNSENPTVNDNIEIVTGTSIGSFSAESVDVSSFIFELNYVRAYATNNVGTSYGNNLTFTPDICLAKGTEVLLSDFSYKKIEDIEYTDLLLVWNFDECKFDTSTILWIKQPQISKQFNFLKFSDGSELKTISQHRIFNKELGKFTYPMTNETPIGTTTFNSKGEEVFLISKEIIYEEVEHYNIITNNHINIFANNILTSCRYNNIYPIQNMKFIKDNRILRTREEFINIDDSYFYGLRLSEQRFSINEIESYINRLMLNELSPVLI